MLFERKSQGLCAVRRGGNRAGTQVHRSGLMLTTQVQEGHGVNTLKLRVLEAAGQGSCQTDAK